MHNLLPLNTVPIDEFDLIHSSKQDPAHIALQILRPTIIARYNEYKIEFDNNTLENLTPMLFSPNQIQFLKDCYGNTTNALSNLIARIKKEQPNHLRSICQYCGIDTDNTTDHYLPQSTFPEFSINHLNLFPCCAVCNPIKNNYWLDSTNNYRGIVNLYTDILPDLQFLFIDIKFISGNALMKFRIDNPNGINPDLYQVIENHFSRINLLEKYNDKTGNIYERTFNSYNNKSTYSGKPNLIKQDLMIEVNSHFKSFGRNHYEGVLKEALANNNDFLNLF